MQTFGLVLKKIKIIFCVLLGKIEGNFKCWIWVLIYINHFYNLDLVEFKFYNAPTSTPMPLINLEHFFQKISTTYKLFGENKKFIFNQKNPYCPKSMLSAKF